MLLPQRPLVVMQRRQQQQRPQPQRWRTAAAAPPVPPTSAADDAAPRPPHAAAAAGATAAGAAVAPSSQQPQQQQQPFRAPPLRRDTLDPRVLAAEYAVRGEIVQQAQLIEAQLAAGGAAAAAWPFDRVVWCNIGNPQILGQAPITFFRQVLSLCEYPALLDAAEASLAAQQQQQQQQGGGSGGALLVGGDGEPLFPADVVARARELLAGIPGGIGAYSDSAGVLALRARIAAAIARRDGHAADPGEIYLSDGASPGVHYLVEMLVRDGRDALLVPIPQYPLYSAALALYGGQLVPYELDEDAGWGMDAEHLAAQVDAAAARGLCVRAMVVINPGNPTGQCLSRADQEAVVRFCEARGLVLVADEVYQANVYAEDRTWTSFKQVVRDLGSPVPLASLHSTSKGFIGECGRRGGYMELVNVPADVHAQVLKLASINLSPNVSGQICCTLMMTPPEPGQPSYARYAAERDGVLGSLARRADALVRGLNALEGVACARAEGALYAFPRITLPAAAHAAAAARGRPADWLYCSELLEATGIVVVPGSGFGQREGTWHFRTTFLPPEADMADVVARLGAFHAAFLAKYGGL